MRVPHLPGPLQDVRPCRHGVLASREEDILLPRRPAYDEANHTRVASRRGRDNRLPRLKPEARRIREVAWHTGHPHRLSAGVGLAPGPHSESGGVRQQAALLLPVRARALQELRKPRLPRHVHRTSNGGRVQRGRPGNERNVSCLGAADSNPAWFAHWRDTTDSAAAPEVAPSAEDTGRGADPCGKRRGILGNQPPSPRQSAAGFI